VFDIPSSFAVTVCYTYTPTANTYFHTAPKFAGNVLEFGSNPWPLKPSALETCSEQCRTLSFVKVLENDHTTHKLLKQTRYPHSNMGP
jgi:hypothetical protein